jgi:hypothetical protein
MRATIVGVDFDIVTDVCPKQNGSNRTDEGGLCLTKRNARMLPAAVQRLKRANIAVRTARELQRNWRSSAFAATPVVPGMQLS